MFLYTNIDNIMLSWRRIADHLNSCLDSYILPEYRVRIFIIYSIAFALLILRVATGRPILETAFGILLKNPYIRSFVYSERAPSHFINVSYSIFSHVFPLLFPFMVTFMFALFSPNTETRIIY